MAVLTDSPAYAASVLPGAVGEELAPGPSSVPELEPVLGALISPNATLHSTAWNELPFHLLISEFSPRSQYDQLMMLARGPEGIPDRVACLAGSGKEFHGFKGRAWAALPGNLHLSVHLAPNRPVDRFHVAFTALAALSMVEAIVHVRGLSEAPRIKWVNDILMGSAKVGGILAYTQSRDKTVNSVVLGLGLNVETTPQVDPTPFVPRVASLRDFLLQDSPQDLQRGVLASLLEALDRNYRELLDRGPDPLLRRYRDASMLVGREVTVCTDSSDLTLKTLAQGRVVGFGENLELILEGGMAPLSSGRVVLGGLPTPSPPAPS